MTQRADAGQRVLIVTAGDRLCAMRLADIAEIMRPLPLDPVAAAPRFVRGVSLIRGMPTPVVDLCAVLGMEYGACGRLVIVHMGARQVAIGVTRVIGVRDLASATILSSPPLLQGAAHDAVSAMAVLDERMLTILRSGWELPEEIWEAIGLQETASC